MVIDHYIATRKGATYRSSQWFVYEVHSGEKAKEIDGPFPSAEDAQEALNSYLNFHDRAANYGCGWTD